MINTKINPKYAIVMKDFFPTIKVLFSQNDETIHKARNQIKCLSYANERFIVKSFKVPHLLNKIVYGFFRDCKAKKSYENSLRIIDFVPEPIGYITFKKWGLLFESYFVSLEFAYDFTIREPLLDKHFEDREEVFKAFALFTYRLHEEGICHLDYSPGNILIKKEEGGYVFKIVDINRMVFKTLSLKQRLQNFSMLWAKDEDIQIIVSEYAKLIGKEINVCVNKAIAYSVQHKKFKNFKKRVKGKKIVD